MNNVYRDIIRTKLLSLTPGEVKERLKNLKVAEQKIVEIATFSTKSLPSLEPARFTKIMDHLNGKRVHFSIFERVKKVFSDSIYDRVIQFQSSQLELGEFGRFAAKHGKDEERLAGEIDSKILELKENLKGVKKEIETARAPLKKTHSELLFHWDKGVIDGLILIDPDLHHRFGRISEYTKEVVSLEQRIEGYQQLRNHFTSEEIMSVIDIDLATEESVVPTKKSQTFQQQYLELKSYQTVSKDLVNEIAQTVQNLSKVPSAKGRIEGLKSLQEVVELDFAIHNHTYDLYSLIAFGGELTDSYKVTGLLRKLLPLRMQMKREGVTPKLEMEVQRAMDHLKKMNGFSAAQVLAKFEALQGDIMKKKLADLSDIEVAMPNLIPHVEDEPLQNPIFPVSTLSPELDDEIETAELDLMPQVEDDPLQNPIFIRPEVFSVTEEKRSFVPIVTNFTRSIISMMPSPSAPEDLKKSDQGGYFMDMIPLERVSFEDMTVTRPLEWEKSKEVEFDEEKLFEFIPLDDPVQKSSPKRVNRLFQAARKLFKRNKRILLGRPVLV